MPPDRPRIELGRRIGAGAQCGRRAPLEILAFALALTWSQAAWGHGGVVAEEDLCLLKMGFLQAHFTLYLPETRGSEEFCEDLPEAGDALFVIEYLHEAMKEMPIEFRILRDDQGFGIFANWEDVQSIERPQAQTVFSRVLAPEPTGWVALRHRFDAPGGYIGLVLAENQATGKTYHSVFYFEVGSAGYGYIPLFLGLILAAQLLFSASTGALQRALKRLSRRIFGGRSSRLQGAPCKGFSSGCTQDGDDLPGSAGVPPACGPEARAPKGRWKRAGRFLSGN